MSNRNRWFGAAGIASVVLTGLVTTAAATHPETLPPPTTPQGTVPPDTAPPGSAPVVIPPLDTVPAGTGPTDTAPPATVPADTVPVGTGAPAGDSIPATSATWTTVADGIRTTTGATVSGLANGTAYVFRVAAKTSYGVGSYATVGPLTPTP